MVFETEFLKISDRDPYASLGSLDHALSPCDAPVSVFNTFVSSL